MSVVILTFNEEANVAHAIRSVSGWARQVLVLDSFSSDRTVEIARAAGADVYQHAFESYAAQRNYALRELPIDAEWVFFLDADEWLPSALRHEITARLATRPSEDGFAMRYRLIWNGTWIRRGYYPNWILRLVRRSRARCDARPVGEHLLVEGATGRLAHDIMHEDRKGIHAWIAKHNAYATGEARELLVRREGADYVGAGLFGTQAQRKRWLRERVWIRTPALVRPFVYFAYRYILAGGFLDGRQAFVFHFLQALWYQFLIDLKYLEMRRARAALSSPAPDAAPIEPSAERATVAP